MKFHLLNPRRSRDALLTTPTAAEERAYQESIAADARVRVGQRWDGSDPGERRVVLDAVLSSVIATKDAAERRKLLRWVRDTANAALGEAVDGNGRRMDNRTDTSGSPTSPAVVNQSNRDFWANRSSRDDNEPAKKDPTTPAPIYSDMKVRDRQPTTVAQINAMNRKQWASR